MAAPHALLCSFLTSFLKRCISALHFFMLSGRAQAHSERVEAVLRSAPWANGALGMAPGSRRILQCAVGPGGSPQVLPM